MYIYTQILHKHCINPAYKPSKPYYIYPKTYIYMQIPYIYYTSITIPSYIKLCLFYSPLVCQNGPDFEKILLRARGDKASPPGRPQGWRGGCL